MKEVQEKVDSIKNNVKNVGKKVEEVASVAKVELKTASTK